MRHDTVFVPNLESGATKLCVYKMENKLHGKKTQGKQVLKRSFYYSYFTRYSVTDNQGSKEFIQTFTLRPYVSISKDCTCVN